MEYDHQGTGEISATDYNIHVAADSTPAELDFSLTYKIGQQFKIFIEYKASGETAAFYDDNDITITSPYEKSAYDDWDRESIINQGPVLDIKYIILLFNNTDQQKKYSYKGIGNNSTIILSYFIEPLRTAISVGGRSRFLKYFAESGSPSLSNDYFYGISPLNFIRFRLQEEGQVWR